MTLRRKGKFSYGEGHPDIREMLRGYSRANKYPTSQFADAHCVCGGNDFQVQIDEEAGAAVRTCAACRNQQPIADSAEYLAEAELEECACPCGGASFEMSVGLALYASGSDVKWLYLGLRCIQCGLVACYGDWKNEYIGYEQLLLRV